MSEWKLDPVSVRKTARTVMGCREDGSLEDDSVISFVVGLDSNDASRLARINVYTKTATIGTCRVFQGQVREIFKRNVSSTNALRRILSHPPTLTTIGDDSLDGTAGAKESLPNKMELAEVGMCILLSEKEKLQQHLEGATEAARENDHEVSVDFEFGLPKRVMKQVEQCLKDILGQGKFVTCVATNGKCAVFLYGHGGVAYTPNVPKSLHQKLKQLKHGRAMGGSISSMDTRPSYVAIGTRERYYVAFHDGTADWKASKALDKCLKRRSTPRSVAFGDKYDSYFVVFEDGSWECNDAPKELMDKLEARQDKTDLVCVTLGPNGEWFLRAQNGRMWWGNISEELDDLIQKLLESDRYLNFIDFGDDSTYFLSYD